MVCFFVCCWADSNQTAPRAGRIRLRRLFQNFGGVTIAMPSSLRTLRRAVKHEWGFEPAQLRLNE
jgi:hypothetical protein